MDNIQVKLIHDLASGKNQYKNLLHGVMDIKREMGIGGLYRGVWPQILKETSSNAMRFPLFTLM